MILAGLIAGWFVAKDATNYTVIQGMFSILLMAVFVAVVAFWPNRWTFRRNRPDQTDEGK